MAQYIDRMLIPSSGSIRHVVGFGSGDPGYDVVETRSKENAPCILYFYRRGRDKCSVSVTKFQGRYFLEHCVYNDMNSLLCTQKKDCTLRNVTRDFLPEAVKAYRAFRMLNNEYTGFRDDIRDAMKQGIGCIYLGRLGKEKDRLMDLMARSGFHVESFNFDTITTKEGICLSLDGLCFRQDEVIP